MLARHVSPLLVRALADSPVVFIQGARQVGKSTLAQWVAQRSHPARYLTLDDAVVLSAARSDPVGFLGGLEGPVVLDEIQRAPELFLPLKAEVDRSRRPGRFLLTGSANALVLPRLAEYLVGRMEIMTLWPFSQGELEGVREGFIDAVFSARLTLPPPSTMTRAALAERIVRGGYPEAVRRKTGARRSSWFASYLGTLLQRDVRELANIEGLAHLPRLLSLLAARTAGLLNVAELSRTAGLPHSTVTRYLALLESTFVVQLVPAWSANLGMRLVRAPKVFLADSGLTAHLTGYGARRLAEDGLALGPALEGFAVMELRKQSGWGRRPVKLLHFRSQAGQEVDVVLEDGSGQLVGIEVKSTATPSAGDFRGLRALAEVAGKRFLRGILLHTGREAVPFGRNLHALPVDALWRLGATRVR